MKEAIITVGVIVGMLLGTIIGIEKGVNIVRAEAIKANAACYTVDPQTGKTTFTWKNNQ